MKKRIIKIGGAGIAGLSAAINLKSAGFDVLIYEKNRDVGEGRHNDWQGLENWSGEEDVLEFLEKRNIKINFSVRPFREAIGLDSDLNEYKVKSKVPLFYLVKRGNDSDSLDQCLKKQAQEKGVRFEFNKTVGAEQTDIFAVGRRKRAFGVALGLNFETNFENAAVCLLDSDIAPRAYGYLLVFDRRATLAVCSITLKKHLKFGSRHLKKAIKKFQNFAGFSIRNPQYFAGAANIGFLKNKDKIYVGEAAGFQDGLLGFGMKYGFLSGYLAAQSFSETDDYQKANKIYWQKVKKEIYPLMKTSIVNRFVYEFFSDKTYKRLLKKMVETSDIRKFIQKQYQPSFYKKLFLSITGFKAKEYLID